MFHVISKFTFTFLPVVILNLIQLSSTFILLLLQQSNIKIVKRKRQQKYILIINRNNIYNVLYIQIRKSWFFGKAKLTMYLSALKDSLDFHLKYVLCMLISMYRKIQMLVQLNSI